VILQYQMVPEHISTRITADDRLSLIFGALAHPMRRRMLDRLTKSEASVAELAAPFNVSVRAISKHVGVLERAGLVTRAKDQQRRPSQLKVAALREAYEWLDVYRDLWEKRFNRIDAVLAEVQKGTRTGGRKRPNTRR
jgi:DNA-binding transcriptional ArsR family regulator